MTIFFCNKSGITWPVANFQNLKFFAISSIKLLKRIFFYSKEQSSIAGRALIEQKRLEQLANIEANKKAALASLKIQYAAANKIKTSFGYIGIISLGLL